MKTLTILLLLIISGLLILSCQSLKIPTYKYYDNLSVDNLGLKKSNLSIDLHYFNPNNVSIVLDKSELDIYINDNLLGHSSQKFQQTLIKKAEFVIPLKFEIDMKNILKNSFAGLLNKEVNVRIKGKIRIGKGKIFTNFPINYTTKQSFSIF